MALLFGTILCIVPRYFKILRHATHVELSHCGHLAFLWDFSVLCSVKKAGTVSISNADLDYLRDLACPCLVSWELDSFTAAAAAAQTPARRVLSHRGVTDRSHAPLYLHHPPERPSDRIFFLHPAGASGLP